MSRIARQRDGVGVAINGAGTTCADCCGQGADPCCEATVGYFIVELVAGAPNNPNSVWKPISPSTYAINTTLNAVVDAPNAYQLVDDDERISYLSTEANAGISIQGSGALPNCRATLRSLTPIAEGPFAGKYCALALFWPQAAGFLGPQINIGVSAAWSGDVAIAFGTATIFYSVAFIGSGGVTRRLTEMYADGRVTSIEEALITGSNGRAVVRGGVAFNLSESGTVSALASLSADYRVQAQYISGPAPGDIDIGWRFAVSGCGNSPQPFTTAGLYSAPIQISPEITGLPNNPGSLTFGGSGSNTVAMTPCRQLEWINCGGVIPPCLKGGAPIDPRCCRGELPPTHPLCQAQGFQCCPTPTGYAFNSAPQHRVFYTWDIFEYTTSPPIRLLKRWYGRVLGVTHTNGCLGTISGVNLTNMLALDPYAVAAIATYPDSGPPTITQGQFELTTRLGNDTAFPGGANMLLRLYNGPTTGSPLILNATANTNGTVTGTASSPLPPLNAMSALATASFPTQLTPSRFWRQIAAEIKTNGLYQNRMSVFIAANTIALESGYGQCPSVLSTAAMPDPSTAARMARALRGDCGCRK